MLRYSRTALKELSRMYRAVLKHCLLIALSWGMTVSPVLATETGNKNITTDTTWTGGYNDNNGTITITNAKLITDGKISAAKEISLVTDADEKKVELSVTGASSGMYSIENVSKMTLSGPGTSVIGTSDFRNVLNLSLKNKTKSEITFTNLFHLTDENNQTMNGTLSLEEGTSLTLKGNDVSIKNVTIAKDAQLTAKDVTTWNFSSVKNFSNNGTFTISSMSLNNNIQNHTLQIEGTGKISADKLEIVDSDVTFNTNNDIEVKSSFSNKGQVFINGTLTIDNTNSNVNTDKGILSVSTLKITSGSTIKSGKESTLLFSYLDNEGVVISNGSLFLFSDTSSEKTTQTGTIENKGTIKIEDADGVTRTADHTLYIYDNVEFKNTGSVSIGLLDNRGKITGDTGNIDIKSDSVKNVSQNTGSITGGALTLESITFKNTGSLYLKGTLDLKNNVVFENTSSDLTIGALNISSNSTFKTSQPFYIYGVTNIYETGKLLVAGDINVIGGVSNSGVISGTGKLSVGSAFTNNKEVSVSQLQVVGLATNNDKLTISGDGTFDNVLTNKGIISAQNISLVNSSGYENNGTITALGVFKDNGAIASENKGTLNVGTYISEKKMTNSEGIINANSISFTNAELINKKEIKATNLSLINSKYEQSQVGASLSVQNFSASSNGAKKEIKFENGTLDVRNVMSLSSGESERSVVDFKEPVKVNIGTLSASNFDVTTASSDFIATNVDLANQSEMTNTGTTTINSMKLSGNSLFKNEETLKGLSNLTIADAGSKFTNETAKIISFDGQMNINGQFDNKGTVNNFNGNIIAGKSAVITSATGVYTDTSSYKFVIQNATINAISGAQVIGNYEVLNNGNLTVQGDISSSNNIFKLGQKVTMTVYTNSSKVNTIYNYGENNTLKMIVDSYRDGSFTYTVANKFIGSDFDQIPSNNLYNVSKTSTPGTYVFSKKSATELMGIGGSTDQNVAQAVVALMGNPTASPTFNAFYQGLLQEMQSADPATMQNLVKKVELMNPETTPTTPTVSQEITNQVYSAVSTRLSGGYISAYDTGTTGKSGGEDFLEGWSTWTQLLHSKGKYSQNTNGFTSRSNGFALGLENYFDYDVKYGFGYSFMKTKVNTRSGRKTNGTSHSIFAYGEYSPSEWFFNDIMTYSFMSTDEKSSVKTASYDTQVFSNQVTAGYQFQYDDFDFVPSLGVRYQHVKNKEYKDSLSNRIKQKNTDTLTGVLGIAIGTDFDYHGMYFRPELRAAYTYDFQHPGTETEVTLANNNRYTVKGTGQKRDGYELGLSLIFDISDEIEFSLNYEGHFKKGYRENTGMINFKYEY